ncbi:MAG: O-antigen ligase family protein [Pseudomonadota bacterium]
MILGGGGSPSPYPEMALQVLSLMLLAGSALIGPRPVPAVVPVVWWLVGLLLVLPVVQLVPMPPAWWHALPGREVERAALALVGAENSWRPWTVSPSRTLASVLALITPAIVLLMTASLDRPGRSMVTGMIAGCAVLALLVGAGQLAGGQGGALRFYDPDVGYLNGFQANHNSAADVLLIGMVAFAAAARDWTARPPGRSRPGFRLAVVGVATLVFSLGVVLTASRAGTALLPVALAGVLAIVWPWMRLTRAVRVGGVIAALLAIAAGLYLWQHNAVIGKVLSRYNFEHEFRPQLWTDAVYAARQYFPFGAGMGTFVPVFLAAERLEVVDLTRPNRAHSDGLELLIEGGVFGLAILGIIVVILVRMLVQGLKNPPAGSVAQILFAGATLCIIALHSQVD